MARRPDVYEPARGGITFAMSLRNRAVERQVTLPDGSAALIRVGVLDDPYVAQRELDTVTAEIVVREEVVATVNTVLDADQESEAVELAREIAEGLESGALEPTAAAIEPLADRLR
jgi:undecaprenyl pyrophosphate synthase